MAYIGGLYKFDCAGRITFPVQIREVFKDIPNQYFRWKYDNGNIILELFPDPDYDPDGTKYAMLRLELYDKFQGPGQFVGKPKRRKEREKERLLHIKVCEELERVKKEIGEQNKGNEGDN